MDASALVQSSIDLPVQINGKVRGKVQVPADADDATVMKLVLEDQRIQTALEGKTVVKSFVVAGRLVNLVAK